MGAVVVPGRNLQQVEDGFHELTKDWPRENGEVKGKRLHEEHFEQLCRFLEPYAVLFECSVIDMGCATEEEVKVIGRVRPMV